MDKAEAFNCGSVFSMAIKIRKTDKVLEKIDNIEKKANLITQESARCLDCLDTAKNSLA